MGGGTPVAVCEGGRGSKFWVCLDIMMERE